MVLCCIFNDIEQGYKFGILALNLLNKLSNKEFHSRTLLFLLAFVMHWKSHPQDSLSMGQTGYQVGLETGDLENTAWNCFHECQTSYLIAQELSELKHKMKNRSDVILQTKHQLQLDLNEIQRQAVLNLIGDSENPCILIGEAFNETQAIPEYEAANSIQLLHCIYLHKLILSFLFAQYSQAVNFATMANKYINGVIGQAIIPVFHYYDSLARLAVFPSSSEIEQQKILEVVKHNQEKLLEWSKYAPMNHLHKFYLVEAEKHRILEQKNDAADDYDRAIKAAKDNGYIQEEALANEVAANFYLNWSKQRIAGEYMTQAYYAYTRWGALAKVADLETRYPQLLAPILQQTHSPLFTHETLSALGTVSSSTSSSSISHSFDLAAILKASQTISEQIELEKLLSSLLSIIIENAGADKCVLMLLRDNRLLIKGSIIAGTQPVVLQRLPIEDSQDIPLKLIYKVKHNRQTAVIVNANVDLTLANDPYIMANQPKSILCTPILHQGKLLGILYLENKLATGAFSSDRIELLNLLCAQAAISLENAQLYEREQEKSQSLQASLEQLQKTEASLAKEREFLKAIIHNITDGIVVCDASGNLTLFNKATREFHGLPMESLPTEQWAEYFSLYQKDGETPLLTTEIPLFRALQGEIVENAEMVIASKQGSRRILLASGQAIFDPWGNKVGAVVVMRDISERARLEAERKIAELALQQKSLDLQQALQDLQQAQLQIVQSEKMSALGNLVAGVAHEMNNPLGFITASIKQAKPTIVDIFEHLKIYQETFPDKSEEIQEHESEIDLEYSLEDLPKMLDSMTIACDRLKNISTSLRTFSRADKDYKVPFNIHEGIDSTILILKHRLKANEQRPVIEVLNHYGNLSKIECFPGQLNQVFMNILANAIDALEESNNGRSFQEIKAQPNRIMITTSLEKNLVKIAIADNGKGMSESVKEKVFNHLFTTKAVGKGTGLGLAIARQIVEETHGGKLSCKSVLGEGTEFMIEIPVV